MNLNKIIDKKSPVWYTQTIPTPEIVNLYVVRYGALQHPTYVGTVLIIPFKDFESSKKATMGYHFKSVVFSCDYTEGSSWSDAEQFTYYIRSRMIEERNIIVLR
jgi:hypothetical protein